MEAFLQPKDIKKYGEMIQGFIDAARFFANLMLATGYNEATVKRIAGIGRFNALSDSKDNFTRYGPYHTEPPGGLFGAFGFMHFPELALAKKMPGHLGARGYRLVKAEVTGFATAKLNEIGFGYTTRRDDKHHGRITLQDGDPQYPGIATVFHMAAGSVITPYFTSRRFEKKFSMTDANGRPIEASIATRILWGHIEAKYGFKKFGENGDDFDTMFYDALDDDETAENHLVTILDWLRTKHKIDLLPEFVKDVERASMLLNQREDMLQCIAAARAILVETYGQFDETVAEASAYYLKPEVKKQAIVSMLKHMPEHIRALDRCVAMLDLKLPNIAQLSDDLDLLVTGVPVHFKHALSPYLSALTDAYYRSIFVNSNTYLKTLLANKKPAISCEWLIGNGYDVRTTHPDFKLAMTLDTERKQKLTRIIISALPNSKTAEARQHLGITAARLHHVRKHTYKANQKTHRRKAVKTPLHEVDLFLKCLDTFRDKKAQTRGAPVLNSYDIKVMREALTSIAANSARYEGLGSDLVARLDTTMQFIEACQADWQMLIKAYGNSTKLCQTLEIPVPPETSPPAAPGLLAATAA